MSRLARFAVACVVTLTVTAATAGELVYFANGTFLKIDSHELKGEMIQVQLDATSKLAFPMRMIERIEGVAGVVWAKGSGTAPNQALPAVALPASANANSGVRSFASGTKKSWNPDPASGLRGSKPAQTGFSMVGESGDQSYLDGVVLRSYREAPQGTIARGDKVIVNPEVMTSKARQPVRIGPKGAIPAAIPTAPNPTDLAPPEIFPDIPPDPVVEVSDEFETPTPTDEATPEPEPEPGNDGGDEGN